MHYWDRETIHKIRRGYYSALYFNRTKHILLQENNLNSVTMQIFQKNEDSLLCGIDEVIELFKIGAGFWQQHKWINTASQIQVKAIPDGNTIGLGETVMHITGPYAYFAHLESIYLGILARRTLVATNTKKVVNAANGKPVIFLQIVLIISLIKKAMDMRLTGEGYQGFVLRLKLGGGRGKSWEPSHML